MGDVLTMLADRQAITDCLVRYCRGIDRLDEDLIRSAYWEDSVDDHGSYQGNGFEFAAWVVPVLRDRFLATHHAIMNTSIDLDGTTAHVETYVHALHLLPADAEGRHAEFVFLGRYIDRFEKRSGQWRIAERAVVHDWSRVDPIAGGPPRASDPYVPGRRDRDDLSYRR